MPGQGEHVRNHDGGHNMLRNGRFIREEPPKIGLHWVPKPKEDALTPEERFAQNLLLGIRKPEFPLFARLFGSILKF